MSDHHLTTEEAWARFDDHVIFDVQRMDEVLAANEQARFEEWADRLGDAFEDGDSE